MRKILSILAILAFPIALFAAETIIPRTQIPNNSITPIKLYKWTGTPGADTFYRGDGAWASPTGTGLGDMNTVTYDPSVTGKISVVAGGTGQNTSAVTGYPIITGGTWSFPDAAAFLASIGAQPADSNLDTLSTPTGWRIFYSNSGGTITELALGAEGSYLRSTGASGAPEWNVPTGAGDVAGPAGSTSGNIVTFSGTSGKTIQDSGYTLTAAGGAITGAADAAAQRTALGLGTAAQQTTTNFQTTGGSINATIGAITPASGTFTSITRGTVSDTEFSYLDGVTSAIQTQLNNKQALDNDLTTLSALGNWKLPYSNGSGVIAALDNGAAGQYLTWTGSAYGWGSPVTSGGAAVFSSLTVGSVDNTEFGYLNGVTSNIQSQLGTKQTGSTNLSTLSSAASPGVMYVPSAGNWAVSTGGLGTLGQVLTSTGSAITWSAAGSGDVSGPAGAVDNAIVLFNLSTGKVIKSSSITVTDNTINIQQGTTGGMLTLREGSGGGSEYRSIKAPDTLSDNVIFLLPTASPTNGQTLLFGTPSSGTSTLTFGTFASPLSVSGSNVTIADQAIGVAKITATGTPDATTYLRGDGVWGYPPGSGDMVESAWASGGYITVAKGGTGAGTQSGARTGLGLGTISTYNAGTLTDTKYCTYSSSGTQIVCNSEGGASVTPAGSDNQIQYRLNGTTLGAIPGAGYNATDNSVTFPGPIKTSLPDGYNYIEVANAGNVTSPTEGMCWFNKTTVKWMCRDSTQNVEIGPAAASINDNSIAPVKLQYSSGTADNTTFYRGDGVWGTPVTGSPGDNTVTPAKLYATSGTAGAGYYYQGNGTWGTPSGSGDMSESVWASGGYITVAKGGTGAGTAANARTNLGLGTIATQASDNVSITGGTINVTGVITGKINVVAKSGSPTLSGSELYGTIIESASTQTITLPAKVQGMQLCILSTSANAVTIAPNGSDLFVYEGTSFHAGHRAVSSGADGDYICLLGSSVTNKWYVTGHGKNAWTDGS